MDVLDEDDFTFEAPAEDEEEANSPVAKMDSGDFKNVNSPISAPISASRLVTSVNRLVLSQEKPKRIVEREPKNLDESQKSLYVAGLLRKLNSVDTFYEPEVSYPYWHSLSYLCSLDGDSNTVATLSFVQEGGIALAVRTLHDFMVFGPKDDQAFGIVTEILRCLVMIYGGAFTSNIDTEGLVDILASMIDLRQWDLVKTIQIGSKESEFMHLNMKIKDVNAIIGPKVKKDPKKLSIIFPTIMPPVEATDFEMYLVEFPDEKSQVVDTSGVWNLRPRVESAAVSPTREPEMIRLISKLNSVAFLATGKFQEEKFAIISSAVDQLISEGGILETYKNRPTMGTIVLVRNDQDLEVPYIRALVVSLECDRTEVVVFAIDLGLVKRVHVASCYQVPEELKKMKPAIFICLLRGAVPAPHAAAFGEALKVFHNLSSRWTSKQLLKSTVIDALLRILRLVDQESVVEMGLKILTNVAAPSVGDRELITDRGTLEQLFLLGADLTEKSEDQPNMGRLNLLQHVIECLTNLVKYNQSARRKLTDMKGALLPNVVLSHYGKETAVHQAALNLSHALMSEAIASEEYQEKVKQWSGKSTSKKECSALNKLLLDALKVEGGKVSFEACFTPEMAKSCTSVQSTADALKPTAEVQDILRHVSVPLAGDRFYLQGGEAKLAGGQWNVICDDVTDLHCLKTRFIQELCCAALNSRQRLGIYFGLERDGQVRGIRVNPRDKDEFRLGIDWSLSRAFRPFLEPTMYNVEFVPVCIGEHQPQAIPDLFVVEMQILHIATEAYQLDKDGAVYLRVSDQVVRLNLQEAGEYFAYQIDKEKKKKLLRLRRQIAIVKAFLEKCDG